MFKPVLFVVDDDEQELQLLERDLKREYGERYRVLGAKSGQEALKKLRQLKNKNEPVALLVADYEMPQMNGIEFLDQAVTLFPDAKRVLLTAITESEAAIGAIKAFEIDYYLMKPSWMQPGVPGFKWLGKPPGVENIRMSRSAPSFPCVSSG